MFDDLIKEHAELMRITRQNENLIRGYIVITLKEVLKNLNSVNDETSLDDMFKIIAENKVKIKELVIALDD